jgi:hypothetical protein
MNDGKGVRMNSLYAEEVLGADDDDGTMPANVAALSAAVVGHRIVKVEKGEVTRQPYDFNPDYVRTEPATVITLDNGTRVGLVDTADCCAYTDLETFLLHADQIDHIITGVGTTDGYAKWHIYADMGDVLELTVGWSCGNPFYYGYGFDIAVELPGHARMSRRALLTTPSCSLCLDSP